MGDLKSEVRSQKSEERRLWEIVQDILVNHGNEVDKLSIHDFMKELFTEFEIHVYHADGYYWNLEKKYCCESDEVHQFDESVDSDGFEYSFIECWEEYNKAGIKKAIEILGQYGKEAHNGN